MDVLVLILIGLVGGLVTGLSPCILPVLPVVLAASLPPKPTVPGSAPSVPASVEASALSASALGSGADSGGPAGVTAAPATDDRPSRRSRRRPYMVIAGLVTSFTIFTLTGTALLSALGLPPDLLRTIGIVILVAVGTGLLIPKVAEWLERPFARLPKHQVDREGGAYVLGLGLGLLFVPCAGPVLTAIAVLSATSRLSIGTIGLTVGFAVGAALPLLAIAVAGDRIFDRIKVFRTHAVLVRRISGVVMIAMAILIGVNATAGLQRILPGYAESIQTAVADSSLAQGRLDELTGRTDAALTECPEASTSLESCGPAPEFTGIQQWLNTDGGEALSLQDLRGKVVLIDFWTYSCINCQRTVPQLADWDQRYRDAGLVTVGVHTPEFPFERDVGNVVQNAASQGVTWPIAIDNGYSTWNDYGNRYWPAKYLVDAEGQVRHVSFGEGQYDETEALIRELLADAAPAVQLPSESSVADSTPSGDLGLTPETYIGYNRVERIANADVVRERASRYSAPDDLAANTFALSGEWTVKPYSSLAGRDAALALSYRSAEVYAVLGGSGRVTVTAGGEPPRTIEVDGSPRLYTLISGDDVSDAQLRLAVSPGVAVYVLTFG